LTCKIVPFWAKTGRPDWQPADLPKGTGYDLPTARRCFAKVLPLTLPYRQNNAVD